MRTNEQIMKACQIGCNNLNDANNLLAECYGRIGRLSEENERLRGIERAAQWYVDNPNSQRIAISQIKAAIDSARSKK